MKGLILFRKIEFYFGKYTTRGTEGSAREREARTTQECIGGVFGSS